MNKDNSQKSSIGASKPKETKKFGDYTVEELDAMGHQESSKLEAEAVRDALNDPNNHNKSK